MTTYFGTFFFFFYCHSQSTRVYFPHYVKGKIRIFKSRQARFKYKIEGKINFKNFK